MELPGLTAASLRRQAAPDSFQRGEAYFKEGAVVSLKRKGPGQVEAHVKGGQYVPYAVRIRHDDAGITDVQCTCPYHAGRWCKHIVAALLACLHPAGRTQPPVAALLDGLDRAALVRLLERLAERRPEWLDLIEEESARLR